MIPKNLLYGSKVNSAAARQLRANIQPQNGTGPYTLGNIIYFNIPTRPNLVMVSTESYLKFDFTFTNNTGAVTSARWDSCGAHGVIKRIRVYHGSNLLEDIDTYSLLVKMLFDIQVSGDAAYGKYNIMAGTRNDLQANVNVAGVTGQFACIQTNSGELCATQLAVGATTAARSYCLNLVSIVGSLCSDKYLPLFAMTSAPLRLEIELHDTLSKCMCVSSELSTIALNNVEFVADCIELSDDAMSVIQGSLNGNPLQFVVPQYRNYQWTTPLAINSTLQINFPIPCKVSSLKSLFVCMRDKGTNAVTYFPNSSVILGTFKDWYFRIGSKILPQKQVQNTTESFAELLKSCGSLGDFNFAPCIDLASYNVATSTAGTVANNFTDNQSGSFYVGLDLENYVGADKSSIFAGWDSTKDDIFFVYDLATGATALNPRFDSFALFDSVLEFSNGTCYIKF